MKTPIDNATQRFHPYCAGCGEIKIKSTTAVMYGMDETPIEILIDITCERYDLCERLMRHVKDV